MVIAAFCLARLYLAVDHPDDVLFGVALGVAIPVAAFRYFTPNEVFPVVYRRGRTAHVDVGGRRGDAIRLAVHDQLGLTVLEIRPVGLESSAGSTPLRLRVEGGPEEYVFAKLYTKGHVRADRWYKLWRTMRYGSLEDEAPFQTVRRLAEYEDYALRLLQDAGIRTPRPYGIVEITPEREYMIVTEFFSGAVELGDADIDDDVIDQGLLLVRRLWDAGVAHRDIKPGNLMVRRGELLLIDVAFAQVRPSPWRQAGRSTANAFKLPSSSTLLAVLAVAAAVIGIVIATRQGRRFAARKLLTPLRSSLASLRQVARSPVRLTMLFGGSALVTLAYVGGLVASVEAFGGGASIAKIGAVYMASAAVAAVTPTPGGVGGFEAAAITGLTGIGISSGAAVSAVVIDRLATYWLPVPPGWLSFRLLQRKDYV